MNITGDKAAGVQLAGLANVTGEEYDGLMMSGLLNVVGEEMNGLQLSGLANVTGGQMNGVQLGLFNFASKAKGLQIGLFNYHKEDMKGLQPVSYTHLHTSEGIEAYTVQLMHCREKPQVDICSLCTVKWLRTCFFP